MKSRPSSHPQDQVEASCYTALWYTLSTLSHRLHSALCTLGDTLHSVICTLCTLVTGKHSALWATLDTGTHFAHWYHNKQPNYIPLFTHILPLFQPIFNQCSLPFNQHSTNIQQTFNQCSTDTSLQQFFGTLFKRPRRRTNKGLYTQNTFVCTMCLRASSIPHRSQSVMRSRSGGILTISRLVGDENQMVVDVVSPLDFNPFTHHSHETHHPKSREMNEFSHKVVTGNKKNPIVYFCP